MQAIHNKSYIQKDFKLTVFNISKIQKCKQFTTKIAFLSVLHVLCLIFQRYKNASNSQQDIETAQIGANCV